MKNNLLALSSLTLSMLLGTSSAFGQSSLQVHVSDAISGTFSEAVTVKVVDSNGEHIGVSDEFGVINFTELIPTEPSSPDEYPSLTLETDSSGYLPHRKEIKLGGDSWHAELALVPRKFGYTTPVISAAKGGKFELPSLGSLLVEPGALGSDARLMLAVIPNTATSPSLLEGSLEYEVWCAALDPSGYPQPGTLPVSPGSVLLTVDLPLPTSPTEQLASETWSAVSFDESWLPLGTTPASTEETGETIAVSIPIREGFNLVERDYRTAATSDDCGWGPWSIEVSLLSTTPVLSGVQTQSVYCGRYSSNDCLEVKAGDVKTTNWEGGLEIESRTKMKAGKLLAEVSASTGVKVTGKYGQGTVKSTEVGKKRCTTSGQPINGDPSPAPPWSCLDGTYTMAQSVAKYQIFATRRCVTASGSILNDTVPGGTIDVPGPLMAVWTDVSINTACTGCDTDPPQEIPSDLPR